VKALDSKNGDAVHGYSPHSDSIMSLLLAYIAAGTETEKFCVHAAPLRL
jgi:hypothetical protein